MYEISYNLHGNDPNFQPDCVGHNKEHTDGSKEGGFYIPFHLAMLRPSLHLKGCPRKMCTINQGDCVFLVEPDPVPFETCD